MLPQNKNGFFKKIILFTAVFFVILFFLKVGLEQKNIHDLNTTTLEKNTKNITAQQTANPITENVPSQQIPELTSEKTQIEDPFDDTDDFEYTKDDCTVRLESQMDSESFYEKNKAMFTESIYAWILDKKDNTTTGDNNLASVHASARYLDALAKASLLAGRKRPLDEQKALEIFEALSKEEPDNSAPLVFAAIIYERQAKTDKVLELTEKIKKTKYFQVYLSHISRMLLDEVNTTSDYLGAISIISQLPIPDYVAVQKFMVSHNLFFLAEQLVKQNYFTEPKSEFLDYFAIEYSVGVRVLDKLKVPHKYPAWKDYQEMRIKKDPLFSKNLSEEFEKSCDIRTLEPVVKALKKYLKTNSSGRR